MAHCDPARQRLERSRPQGRRSGAHGDHVGGRSDLRGGGQAEEAPHPLRGPTCPHSLRSSKATVCPSEMCVQPKCCTEVFRDITDLPPRSV